MPITMIASDNLIPIEQHFRVSAGPGAGKTHWLINHIKNVLQNSDRLGQSRKIACITYTNIAVENILERLDFVSNNVVVCTIHSFLYENIVRPYVSFIANEYNLAVEKMDGHEDHIVSIARVSDWISSDSRSLRYLFSDLKLTVYHLANLRWTLDENNLLRLKITKRRGTYNDGGRSMPFISEKKQDKLLQYKKLYWADGIIHHDDVLFFSYKLLLQFPFILEILRAKYPYFFIDEFQDTNPIQTKILELIGLAECIVGIIGDKAQSIYGFQGAVPDQFLSFTLPNLADYAIANNRRSTNRIIQLLNTIRNDIQQTGTRNEEGYPPKLIIGELGFALQKMTEECNGEDYHSLSRDNYTTNAIKRNVDQNIPENDLFESLGSSDSNSYRRRLVRACIKSIELARQHHFKEALKEQDRVYRRIYSDNEDGKDKSRKKALSNLEILLSNFASFENSSLLDFFIFVKKHIDDSLPSVRAGAVKQFYECHTYQQMAICIKITEDKSFHRTIHKAKGAEFNNVLLVLKEEKDIEFLSNPDLDKKEEHRVNYVAVSRAKNRLFIHVPDLQEDQRASLAHLFDIIYN